MEVRKHKRGYATDSDTLRILYSLMEQNTQIPHIYKD